MEARPIASLRERKRIQTLLDLAEVALDLFSERGYDNVTVEDIATVVDVSPRTFFRYYPSKEDVLFPNEAGTRALLREALLARPPEEPPLVAVKTALLSLAKDFEQRKSTVRIRREIILGSPSLRSRALEQQVRWEEILTETVAERMRSSPDLLAPRLVAAACVSGMRVAIETWLDSDEDRALVDIAGEVLDLLDRGLGVDADN